MGPHRRARERLRNPSLESMRRDDPVWLRDQSYRRAEEADREGGRFKEDGHDHAGRAAARHYAAELRRILAGKTAAEGETERG